MQSIDVLLGDLHVGLELENVDQELSLVGQLLLIVVDKLSRTRIWQLRQHVEEHSVTVRLLHDLCHFCVQLINQISGRMVNNLVETFETNTSLSNVSIEKSDANHDVGQLAELGDLFWRGQRNERSQTGTRQNRLKSGCNFSLNRIRHRRRQLNVRVLANNVLLIFVEEVVEDLFVEERDALKVISRARLKTDNLIDQTI